MDLRSLYSPEKHAPYYYTFGFSWRGFAAYIAGILINIVGFVGSVQGAQGRNTVPIGAQYIYNLNYLAGIIVAAAVYYILCLVFPLPATSDTWNEVGVLEDDFVTGEDPEDEAGVDVGPDADHKGPKALSKSVLVDEERGIRRL